MASLPQLPAFDAVGDSSNLGPRWEKWIDRFENAMIAFNISSSKRKRALLLHYGGDTLSDVFGTLTTGDNYDQAKAALTAHFAPKRNIIYESIMLRRTKQEETETVTQYCTRLRQMAAYCEFPDTNREILTQIIDKCSSQVLRRRAFEKQFTLDELLDVARSIELASARAQEVENSANTSTPVNKIQKQRPTQRPHRSPSDSETSSPKSQCFFCGGDYPHRDGPCPAKGEICNHCGVLNHFENACLSKQRGRPAVTNNSPAAPVNTVAQNDATDEQYVFTIQTVQDQGTHTGENSRDTHTGENSDSKRTGRNSESMRTGENSESTHTGRNSESMRTDENSESLHTGEHSESARTGENSESMHTGRDSESTRTDENPESMHTGENSDRTRTGENSESTHTGGNSESTRTYEISEIMRTGEKFESTHTDENSESTHTSENSESTHTDGNSDSTHTGEMSESTRTDKSSTRRLNKQNNKIPGYVSEVKSMFICYSKIATILY